MANEVAKPEEKKQLPAIAKNEEKPSPVAAFFQSPKLPASVQVEAHRAMVEVIVKMQSANALPRDEVSIENYFLERSKDVIFAEKAIYAKPINKDATEFVEGPSKWLADELISCWPHTQVKEIEHGEVDGMDQIEVQVWDYQKDIPRIGIWKVTRERWSRSGGTYIEKNPEKQHDRVKSEMSKLRRNTIFKVLPGEMVARIYDACQATRDRMFVEQAKQKDKFFNDYAKKLGITEKHLLDFLSLDKLSEVKGEHLRRLHSLFVAIVSKDVELTVTDVFPEAKNPKTMIEMEPEPDKKAKGGKQSKPMKEENTDAQAPAPAETVGSQESAKDSDEEKGGDSSTSTNDSTPPSQENTDTVEPAQSSNTTEEKSEPDPPAKEGKADKAALRKMW